MREVQIAPTPLDRLAAYLDADRATRLSQYAAHAAVLLAGSTVWNLNATAQGGGVAEMLQTLLAYGRGAGVDTRWLVLERGRPRSSRVTKRLHNLLHGSEGDGGEAHSEGPRNKRLFRRVTADNLAAARGLKSAPGDIVLAPESPRPPVSSEVSPAPSAPALSGAVTSDGTTRTRSPTGPGSSSARTSRRPRPSSSPAGQLRPGLGRRGPGVWNHPSLDQSVQRQEPGPRRQTPLWRS